MVRGSNKSGWLHTFLNYISTFIMEKKSDYSLKVAFVFSELMYSSYKSLYLRDNLH